MFRRGWIACLALVFAFAAAPVFAQGGSSNATLNGVVKDKDGTDSIHSLDWRRVSTR